MQGMPDNFKVSVVPHTLPETHAWGWCAWLALGPCDGGHD